MFAPSSAIQLGLSARSLSQSPTTERMPLLGSILSYLIPSTAFPCSRSIFPLRILGFSSLFLSVQGLLSLAQLDLSSLNGTDGFVLKGGKTWVVHSVSDAGDVNADGVADLLVAATIEGGQATYSSVYVIFGKFTAGANGVIDLSSLNGTNGFVCFGESAGRGWLQSVAGVGDINADGIDDLAIGARHERPDGKTYVVFGSRGSFSSPIELSRLNGSDGFVLSGAKGDDQSGSSVAGAGDVNADGITDLLIGAHWASPSGFADRFRAGKTYIAFGKSGLGSGGSVPLSSLTGGAGFVINGEKRSDQFGIFVSGVGDVNADGVSDFLIGANLASPSTSRQWAAKTYVIFGQTNLTFAVPLELSNLNGTNGFLLNGVGRGDFSEFSVSSAGDVNADGLSDILIGAIGVEGQLSGVRGTGEAYVVFGRGAPPSKPPMSATLRPTEGLNASRLLKGCVLQGGLLLCHWLFVEGYVLLSPRW